MRRLGCLLALVLLGGCTMTSPGSTPSSSPSSPPSPQVSRFSTSEPLPSASGSAEVSPARLSAISADLAGRGVDGASMQVVSAQNLTFNDGSLGCPQPGVQYTQAQVDGMRVVVRAGGQNYDYRFGAGDSPRLCEQARPGSSATTR